jgi:hypothetical protein
MMAKMTVDTLFTVHGGTAASSLQIFSAPRKGTIPFLRPAKSQQRTIAGWVNKSDVSPAQIYPAESLFVSTDGEGSHTHAYVASFEFACGTNVSVLLPRHAMTVHEKIYYARCITLNRFRFSYGRKPKGERLKSIKLPTFPEDWAKKLPSQKGTLSRLKGKTKSAPSRVGLPAKSEPVALDTIFDMRYGHGLDLVSLERAGLDGVRFVSRTTRNNGVAAYVKPIDGLKPYNAGELTCALNGEGGVLYTFLQDEPFYTAYHVASLRPKMPMTTEELLFYCVCIRANRFRYSFGRQANRTLRSIRVPSRSSIPVWVYGSLSKLSDAASLNRVLAA